MITHYGIKTVIIISFLSLIFILLSVFLNNNIVKGILIAVSVILFLFTLYFFRDPERKTESKENVLVSPADGKVIVIKKVQENYFLNEECYQISIFMSPLNVHVNRIPLDGKVEYVNYCSGKYLVASHDKASLENERNYIGITNEKYGKVLYTQVAGALARRIVSELKKGDIVKKGDRFGMIKFGSRVDIYVPLKWNILAKEGQKVYAGITEICEVTQ
ncbi:MAG TPA: phosphatidylserine decarboxylase family protein [Ignavibacteriales bacterium]|nr:phosphatidylserine decarboxylase family protein [Ignavibacteriales bacterium]HOL81014.1 phosphatidylserine decarboxylase family protein [Ignavibacteriales bacterium]HOM64750.1 phosphatidylserine decarboxylase family protein [Ignavibacteriales bacterium]HPD66718.1 phosphatidylserine decarboxylase family protein [Ignavibacteriales bacterium]HPP32794.1 phosphatidylserine decarboxylase family protein [Ignavibacteriales bacterium]